MDMWSSVSRAGATLTHHDPEGSTKGGAGGQRATTSPQLPRPMTMSLASSIRRVVTRGACGPPNGGDPVAAAAHQVTEVAVATLPLTQHTRRHPPPVRPPHCRWGWILHTLSRVLVLGAPFGHPLEQTSRWELAIVRTGPPPDRNSPTTMTPKTHPPVVVVPAPRVLTPPR